MSGHGERCVQVRVDGVSFDAGGSCNTSHIAKTTDAIRRQPSPEYYLSCLASKRPRDRSCTNLRAGRVSDSICITWLVTSGGDNAYLLYEWSNIAHVARNGDSS